MWLLENFKLYRGLALYSFLTELIYTMKIEIHRTTLKEESGNSPYSLRGSQGQIVSS